MNEAIKKLSWTDDKQKSRAAERHRGMCFICRRLRMRWPDAALGSSEAHICHRGSPLTLPSLTWDENGVVLSLSQHPDRVSDEVMVQHRLLPLRVAYELMTALVNYKPPGVKWSDLVFCSRRAPDLPGFGVDEVKKGSDRGENQLLAPTAQTRCWSVAGNATRLIARWKSAPFKQGFLPHRKKRGKKKKKKKGKKKEKKRKKPINK